MYGSDPSSGLRTTSRLVNPAKPSAVLRPLPPVLSTSTIRSVVSVSRYPVNKVATYEVAFSESARKLFGPLYFAWNAGCHWKTTFTCPEIQAGLVAGCGNTVGASSASGGTSCGRPTDGAR